MMNRLFQSARIIEFSTEIFLEVKAYSEEGEATQKTLKISFISVMFH